MEKSGFVAIAGRPNAGKSSLLNHVLQTAISIVTPKAQTTRERVLGILTETGKGQIIFIDTPGIHRAKPGGINEFMVREAREALTGASLAWYIVDPFSSVAHESVVLDILKETGIPLFLLMNKTDVTKTRTNGLKEQAALESSLLAAARERGLEVREVHRISAKTGEGVQQLLASTWKLIQPGPRFFPDEEQLSDRPTRYFVAEKIREQLFLKLSEELPYSCAVEIEKFLESVKPIRIEAIVHVERESQKGMVIGKGGQKIKEIGSAARLEIEKFVGEHVFLGLQVKVLKDWSKNPDALKALGYYLPNRGQK